MKLTLQQILIMFLVTLAGLITGVSLFWLFRIDYYRDMEARLFPDTTPIIDGPEVIEF